MGKRMRPDGRRREAKGLVEGRASGGKILVSAGGRGEWWVGQRRNQAKKEAQAEKADGLAEKRRRLAGNGWTIKAGGHTEMRGGRGHAWGKRTRGLAGRQRQRMSRRVDRWAVEARSSGNEEMRSYERDRREQRVCIYGKGRRAGGQRRRMVGLGAREKRKPGNELIVFVVRKYTYHCSMELRMFWLPACSFVLFELK